MQLSAKEKIIVFARSLSYLSQVKGNIEPQFVDVLLSIALRDNPKGGTELAIAWLEPPRMKLKKPEMETRLEKSNQKLYEKKKTRQECAAEFSWRFVAELAVQLSWKEKLLDKLR